MKIEQFNEALDNKFGDGLYKFTDDDEIPILTLSGGVENKLKDLLEINELFKGLKEGYKIVVDFELCLNEINIDVHFVNIHFLRGVKCKDSSAENREKITCRIRFEKCIFEKIFSAININFNNKFGFLSECVFKDDIVFTNVNFKGEFSFAYSKVEEKVLDRAIILNDQTESLIVQNKKLSGVRFYNVIFNESVDFVDTIFESKVSFKSHVSMGEGYSVKFLKGLNFKNVVFIKKVLFHKVLFKDKVCFENTSFNNLVDFFKSEFENSQLFERTDFMDRAFFAQVMFYKSVQFLYTQVKPTTLISFEGAKFIGGLDISRANFDCSVQYWGIKELENCKIENLSKDELFSAGKASKDEIIKRLRETYRAIKYSFRQEGNNIDAQKYHMLEMKVYEYELESARNKPILIKSIKIFKNIGLCFSSFFSSILSQDKIVLWFNKTSNNFGTSWGRGVLFTVSIALFFYVLIMGSQWNDWEWAWSWDGLGVFFKILNVFDWKEIKLFSLREVSTSTYIILFFARIFISYGYYQTVQAFRKFGRN